MGLVHAGAYAGFFSRGGGGGLMDCTHFNETNNAIGQK